jgi:hypothetical protein
MFLIFERPIKKQGTNNSVVTHKNEGVSKSWDSSSKDASNSLVARKSKDASNSWTAIIGTPAAVPATVSANAEKSEAARTPTTL